jgi:protein-L-isoaspartate(D-aspartate) O-methyltransferase
MRIQAVLLLGVAVLLFVGVSCWGPGEEAVHESPRVRPDYSSLRSGMVDTQIARRGVTDSLVLRAMRTVPRHLFVDGPQRAHAYSDRPLPIGQGQTISQPYIVALMTALLELEGGERVLEVGTGSGYQAAVLAEIAGEVYSIEIIETLASRSAARLDSLGYKNVRVLHGDGYRGWPVHAPFDGIVVTAAPDHVPEPLKEQLKIGAKLVIPVGDVYQELRVIARTPGGYESRSVIPVRFVPMTGEAEGKRQGD